MKERIGRLLLWFAVVGLMTLIFFFSSQPGSQSEELTNATVMPFAELIASLQDGADAETTMALYHFFGTLLRKLAHLCEYGLLGFLMHLLLRSYGKGSRGLPLLWGIAYAMTDEVHQAFVPGRLGIWTDVLIDAVGAAAGIYAVTLFDRIRRKKHVHDQ